MQIQRQQATILNYQKKKRSDKFFKAVIFFALCFYFDSRACAQSEESLKILERWTATHWGDNCFVWVVHYPEEIVTPWTDAEAQRTGMSDAQKLDYKRRFAADLQIYKSETFLVSVYSFGRSPVNLSPVRDNVALINSDGVRIKPSKYNSTLDEPNFGVVQGLVFFPKQPDKNFALSIKGIAGEERIFSFEPPELPQVIEKPKPQPVVVNLPKKKQPPKKVELEFKPTPPPVMQQRPITPIFQEDSSEMEEFVKSLERKKNLDPDRKLNAVKKSASTAGNNSRPRLLEQDNAYISREHLLRRFLSYWADNNAFEMYELLSDRSQKNISRENFAKEISKNSGMREGLKGEYKIDWIGEERAKVTVTHKNLIFKSVSSRTLGVTREGSAWKIVW